MPPNNYTVTCTPSTLSSVATGTVQPGDTVASGKTPPTQVVLPSQPGWRCSAAAQEVSDHGRLLSGSYRPQPMCMLSALFSVATSTIQPGLTTTGKTPSEQVKVPVPAGLEMQGGCALYIRPCTLLSITATHVHAVSAIWHRNKDHQRLAHPADSGKHST